MYLILVKYASWTLYYDKGGGGGLVSSLPTGNQTMYFQFAFFIVCVSSMV